MTAYEVRISDWSSVVCSSDLAGLEARLTASAFLFGARACLADAAIFPFVRQFAHVDTAWFAARPWPALRAWLESWLASDLFVQVMRKYPRWDPGTIGPIFPSHDETGGLVG